MLSEIDRHKKTWEVNDTAVAQNWESDGCYRHQLNYY